MDTIRIAIVGTGSMANSHARNFLQEKGVQLSACCDVEVERAKKFASTYAIPAWYDDYRQMLQKEKLDAVSVVTSDDAHCEVSVAALQKGLHVLCEKPMATSLEEAERMCEAARAAGKMNMIQFSYRPMAALERARQIVTEGLLGHIRHVEASYLQSWLANDAWGDWRDGSRWLWRMSKKHRGGTLADIGCHILDFATYVAGDVVEVSCRLKSFDKGVPGNTWKGYVLDADDSFVASAEFSSGAIGVVHATRWAQGHLNTLRLRVFGDKGSLVVDTDAGWDKLRICVGDFHAKHTLWNTIDAAVPQVSVYSRFIRSIRTGKPEAPTFEDGLRVQRCLDACLRSAETGRPVSLVS